MLYISSDHGGYELKGSIIDWLQNNGHKVLDLGPNTFNPNDDYPDFAAPLAQKVLEDSQNLGILICRNGVGMCIAANKVGGIRCGLSWSPAHAQASRKDDNTNILALAADYTNKEIALEIVRTWLETKPSKEERHIRRQKKMGLLESLAQ